MTVLHLGQGPRFPANFSLAVNRAWHPGQITLIGIRAARNQEWERHQTAKSEILVWTPQPRKATGGNPAVSQPGVPAGLETCSPPSLAQPLGGLSAAEGVSPAAAGLRAKIQTTIGQSGSFSKECNQDR